uniref:Uncharacterized protein n=1 Tax=Escherichia coli TaxID=562 RepID=A0A2S1JEF6_ECOLX|nr:hypothetical protein [Escherichia coli]
MKNKARNAVAMKGIPVINAPFPGAYTKISVFWISTHVHPELNHYVLRLSEYPLMFIRS